MLIRIPKLKKGKDQNPAQTFELSFYQKIRSNTFRQTIIRLNYQQQSKNTKITINQQNKRNSPKTRSEKRQISKSIFKSTNKIAKINLSQTLRISQNQQKITPKFIKEKESKYSLQIQKNLKKERRIIPDPPFRSYDIESFEKSQKNIILPHMKHTIDIEKIPQTSHRYRQFHSKSPLIKFKQFLQRSPRVMFKNQDSKFDMKALTSTIWTLKK